MTVRSTVGRRLRRSGRPSAVAPRGLALLAGVVASAAMVVAAPAASAQGQAASVIVEEVTETDVIETAPVIGQFVASVESAVAARSGGIVDSVDVFAGDRVAQGAVLARLDPALARIAKLQAAASIERARAGVAQAEARLALARQALERSGRLQGSTAFSRGSFEDQQIAVAEAESALASARADQAGAEAAMKRADYDLDHVTIVAPFDGVVLERMAQPGAYIAIGSPVAVLLDIGALEIEIEAPAELVPGLTPGVETRVVVEVGGVEQEIRATVRAVIPREAVATRTRPVRLAVSEEDKATVDAAPGRSVTVFAPTGAPRRAITAPKDSLVQARGGWVVYVAVAGEGDAPGTAEPRPVQLGASFGGLVEIVSGLEPGELVVTRGNERLRPGQPIRPRRMPPPTDGALSGGGGRQG